MFRGPPHGYPGNLDVGHTGRFPRSRSEWIVVRSRLRFGCRCLRPRGGPADGRGSGRRCRSRFGGSAPNGDDGGTNIPVRGGTPGSPVGKITDTLRKTIQGVARRLARDRQPGQQSSGVTSTVGSGRQPGEQSPSVTSTVGRTRIQASSLPRARKARRQSLAARAGPQSPQGPIGRRGSRSGRRGSERGGAGY